MSDIDARMVDILIEAGRAQDRDGLFFVMVNRSVHAVAYDRASLWTMREKPSLLAASGNDLPDRRASFASSWGETLAAISDPGVSGPLTPERFGQSDLLREHAEAAGGLSALWVALPEHAAGLLFERWDGPDFEEGEIQALGRLGQGYAALWKKDSGATSSVLRRRLVRPAIVVVLAAFLAFVRVPLRVVATCEVTARNPRLIAAPMEGVIDEVLVAPGRRVRAGDALAVYDSRLMEEELKVSRRQVEVVEAELASARARGFSDARYRGETALLEARLEQELARLEALDARFSRRLVVAPIDGMVQLDDARAWRGRPVATGQAILWLVNPDDTRLTLWLPQDDRIDLDMNKPISVHLYAMGGAAREARLTYVSSFSQASPDGVYAFPAEAEWLTEAQSPPLGLRGSASLYGDRVSLAYWLFRRPMAWMRRWLGL